MIRGKEDAANNYARATYIDYDNIVEVFEQAIRIQTEICKDCKVSSYFINLGAELEIVLTTDCANRYVNPFLKRINLPFQYTLPHNTYSSR